MFILRASLMDIFICYPGSWSLDQPIVIVQSRQAFCYIFNPTFECQAFSPVPVSCWILFSTENYTKSCYKNSSFISTHPCRCFLKCSGRSITVSREFLSSFLMCVSARLRPSSGAFFPSTAHCCRNLLHLRSFPRAIVAFVLIRSVFLVVPSLWSLYQSAVIGLVLWWYLNLP